MDRDHLLEMIEALFVKGSAAADTGIVDDDVDRPEAVEGALDSCAGLCPVGDRARHADRRAARRDDFVRDLLRACDIIHHHGRSAFGERQRVCSPETAARARDQGDASDEGNALHAVAAPDGASLSPPFPERCAAMRRSRRLGGNRSMSIGNPWSSIFCRWPI